MKCDVFTVGLVLYEILVGVPVFPPSESPFAIMRRLRGRELSDLSAGHGELMQTLLVACWKQDPTAPRSPTSLIGSGPLILRCSQLPMTFESELLPTACSPGNKTRKCRESFSGE
jgi:hypothetical protein